MARTSIQPETVPEVQALTRPVPPGGAAWDEVFWLKTADGLNLRAAVWSPKAPRGLVILSTGRTEFLERASMPAAGFSERGFTVVSVEWRGQGLSDRLLEDPLKGHVEDFADYRTDLAALLASDHVTGHPGPVLVVGHSMGGAIAAGALLRQEMTARAAILSAPLFGVKMGAVARRVAYGSVALARMLGKLDKWPPFGDMRTPYVFSGFKDNCLTQDEEVFAWLVEAITEEPRYGLGMPTFGWMAAARRETDWLVDPARGQMPCPSLCVLGAEERVVDAEAVREAAPRMGIELAEIAGARHEPFMEAEPMRAATWAAIDGFLERQGL